MARDGISSYQINNIKTRRRDVLDLFRGTGLGPRSYSIIEQGMVSRIVEARPEDLRVFVEEAAGTSKYKDRRRETENRIGHTRENLDRVADIRDELGKQLRRLKRQSASAQRYKILKEEERQVNAQLHVLKLSGLTNQLSEQDRLTASHENALQSALARQREIEAELESLRKQQSDANEKNSAIQQNFYRIGGHISNLEQRIEHLKETRQRESEEIERLDATRKERQYQIDQDMQKGLDLKSSLDEVLPKLEELTVRKEDAESRLSEAEKILQEWLSEMEAFNEQSREPDQQVEVQKSRIEYLEQHAKRMILQKEDLSGQLVTLNQQVDSSDIEQLRQQVSIHDNEYEKTEQAFHGTESEIKSLRVAIEEKRTLMAEQQKNIHEATSRLNSLKEIQEAALGGDSHSLGSWLQDNGLSAASKLAAEISVEQGWEKAVDRALNGYLGAICADQFSAHMLENRPDYSFSMVAGDANIAADSNRLPFPRLLDKITRGRGKVASFLSDIYIAESTDKACESQGQLSDRQVFVTLEGSLVGSNWVSFASQSQMETGVLVREEEINQLQIRVSEFSNALSVLESEMSSHRLGRSELESRLQTQRRELGELRSINSSLHSEFARKEAQVSEARTRIAKLSEQLIEMESQIVTDQSEIENARVLLTAAREKSGDLNQQRAELAVRKDDLSVEVFDKRSALNAARDNYHQVSLQKQKLEADLEVIRENLRRLKTELAQSQSRLSSLRGNDDIPIESVDSLIQQLEILFEEKLVVDNQFSESRDQAAGLDNKIAELGETRNSQLDNVNQARELLDQRKLARQEIMVRRETLLESINEQGIDVGETEAGLPEEATASIWQGRLEQIESKITRIGPVNLVAIEEFDEESERMDYLDRQHADLTEALDTLESVIRKIDRETRTRFRETFEKIDAGFKEFFPKLFGGGSAELQLESDDLLTSGIRVMARPPGKRNSHIHLLSGGEKALTAVALLFSLFELNPAPFCMLDEVDAPLDDANVDRYCDTLKRLASKSQMIVITHNKITMEAMDLLVGVTMAEAGVSRLVSVDIDQAVKMATQKSI
jgi:chromosome segregation protein